MRLSWVLALMAALLFGCGARAPTRGTEAEIAALAAALQQMSPDIAAAEAAEAARLSFQSTYDLALAYQITDPPLVHNAKVNAGRKPRGLCYHWAEDMQARLEAAGFATLGTARANADNPILIDHSTTVIVPRGAPMETGVVVDPWRYGGRLFWAPVVKDSRYDWRPREDVLRRHGRIRYMQRPEGSRAPPPVE
ncbi:hypothetical protein AB2B41_03930 [Marimonas sp. MJW-29]|uniref:Lipoprotein n=1 Tax=Sulfitobacter sediminis TaxID=3234186 RepID=A0ABV3RJD7_9RHOB